MLSPASPRCSDVPVDERHRAHGLSTVIIQRWDLEQLLELLGHVVLFLTLLSALRDRL